MPSKPWAHKVMGRGPTNTAEEELADIYKNAANKQLHRIRGKQLDSGEPLIIAPPPDRRQPTALPPSLSSDVEEPMWDYLYRIAPELRGRSESVQFGPSEGVLKQLYNAGMGPEDYKDTNLLGNTSLKTGNISLNPALVDPRVEPGYLDETVAHEMGHTVGIGHTGEMKNIEGLARMVREYQRMKRNKGVASYDMPKMKGMGR